MAGKTAATLDIDDSEVRRLFDRLRTEAPKEARRLLDDAAGGLLESIRDDWLNRPGSGRVYPSRTGTGTHRASAPGEPPAADTHEYRESWETASVGSLARIVYTDDKRATVLEYGGGSILPRPHARPAAFGYKRTFERSIKDMAQNLESIRVL